MCLKPMPIGPVPERTAQVAKAAFPKGSAALRMRDELGGLFDDLIRSPWGGRALVPIPPGVPARAAASAGDNLTDAWRSVEPTLAAKPDASVLIAGGTASIAVFVAMHSAALGSGRMLYVDPDPDGRRLVATLGVETRPELLEPGEVEFDLVVDAGADARRRRACTRPRRWTTSTCSRARSCWSSTTARR